MEHLTSLVVLEQCHGMIFTHLKYIEDICFFEVNTKYISSSELKTSELSRVRSKFLTHEMKYIWYSPKKKANFLFILYNTHAHFPIHKAGGENAKTKNV